LITIKLLGGAKKSFGTDLISADLDNATILDLLEHLLSIKPKNTLELDTKNILVAINGIDSSALEGLKTVLHSDDVVSIIPIIHGGANRLQFKIYNVWVELFKVAHQKGMNYEFLDSIRKEFPELFLQGISSKSILSQTHAKKIIGLSLYAQKNKLLVSKKLQTDILLRFAATTQISEAIKSVGIERHDNFTIIAIGKKSSLSRVGRFLASHLSSSVDYQKNFNSVQKHFKISKTYLDSVDSKMPLEDLLVEKAAVLFT
jgi:tRNA threonylcarbamoyladenosine modification (KEOPS) complex Cgi121 subunit/molybdopterin converting factor small subunit